MRLLVALLILILTAIGCLIAIIYVAQEANAEALPRGLGHPQGNLQHWYDSGCCSLADCEPVEAGAIRMVEGGFYVKYLTSRGFIAEGLVTYKSGGVRQSKDDREHACASTARPLCVYIHMGA